MLKTEILFPEVANLYGDLENISYLKKCSDELEVITDSLTEEPYFVKNEPKLIYMGTMSESSQRLAAEKLAGYEGRIRELIDSGVHFLITGNAIEIFGDGIEYAGGERVKCLGIFDTYAKTDLNKRFNSLYLGEYSHKGAKMDIVGYKSQFSHSYYIGEQGDYAFMTKRGCGLNPEIMQEGLRKNNFIGTYIIGPVLVLNPLFTKALLSDIGVSKPKLAFEKEAIEAYRARLAEYSDEKRGFYY